MTGPSLYEKDQHEKTEQFIVPVEIYSANVISLIPSSQNSIKFNVRGEVAAEIDADGIFRCHVDPTEKNAVLFIEAIEIALGKRLTGVVATHKIPERTEHAGDVRSK